MTTTQQEHESRLWKAASALRRPFPQVVEEALRLDVTKIAPHVVFVIDSIAVEVAYSGWKGSDSGDKMIRSDLRDALKNYGSAGADRHTRVSTSEKTLMGTATAVGRCRQEGRRVLRLVSRPPSRRSKRGN